MPFYKVTTPAGEHFVEAKNVNAAINHVIKPGVTAITLNNDEIATVFRQGKKFDIAAAEKIEKAE